MRQISFNDFHRKKVEIWKEMIFVDNNGWASPGEMKYAVEWRPIFYPKS